MQKEEFITIQGFENYAVSSHGRIQRVTKGINTKPGDFKSIQINKKTGYAHVKVSGSAGRRSMSLHKLVATHFIPNPNNYTEVDHIDRNKTNNHVDNLRWVTRSENMRNVDKNGSKSIWAFPPDGGSPLYFETIRDAANSISQIIGQTYSSTGISNVLNKPNYTHYKKWKFSLASAS